MLILFMAFTLCLSQLRSKIQFFCQKELTLLLPFVPNSLFCSGELNKELFPLQSGLGSLMSVLTTSYHLFLIHMNRPGFYKPPGYPVLRKTGRVGSIYSTVCLHFQSDEPPRSFYCSHPPPPSPSTPTYIPKDIKGYLKWYYSTSFQTVPYTNRTRRIVYPIDLERSGAEIHFKRFKEELMENEGRLLPPTHPDVVRVNMVLNNIISAFQRDLKKMRNATSSYNSIGERGGGCPESGRRRESWNLLRTLARDNSLPWCVVGDYNDLLSNDEKRGSADRAPWLLRGFRDAIQDCLLNDIPMQGHPFTWSRGRGTTAFKEERLDRVLATQDWIDLLRRPSSSS